MKTKLSLCILSLLLSACGDKASRSADTAVEEGSPRGTRNGILLTTELPPEIIIGTPPPIVLPLHTPMSGVHLQSIQVRPNAFMD